MAEHNDFGHWGEELAASFLRDKGYVILERDWRSGHRDLDIIAMDGDVLVFVEVKTRRNRDFMDPEAALDYRKLNSLRLSANHYIKSHHLDNTYRFDVVTIVGSLFSHPEINHIKDFAVL